MNSKQTQALVRVLLILGILVLLNFISVRLFTRLDLTAQKVYTLSEASKKLVGGLDDRVTVKAYFTEDLPAPYNNNRRAVLDILNEYKAYAGGNLVYEFINPEGEKGEQEAQQQGVAPVQVQVVKEDKLEVKRGYLGLVMLYEDRKEVIPVVQNLSSLEYDISSTLKRLTNRSKKKIGYTTGHGEAPLSAMTRAEQTISGQYELVPVDLSRGEAVPADVAALLVISPEKKFADSALYQIDQYVMRGGKVAFFLNRVNANLNARFGQPIELGLDSLLAQYGVRVNADMIRDAQCATITIRQQQGPFIMTSQLPFPYLPLASNFSKDHMIVKDLQPLVFHFVSSLDTTLAAPLGLKSEVLIRSSRRAGRQTGFMMINPFQQYTPADLSEANLPMAVIVEGSFKSYFANRQPQSPVSQSPETRILVVGDGDFMKDEFLGGGGNLSFFANSVDYLADDTGLITIRSKNIVQPPLEEVSDGTKKLLKYGNLIAPPLLVVGYGMFRWQRRKAIKRVMEAQA
jgi:gliding-associated putative ABC transporter substrate-binding component GldG